MNRMQHISSVMKPLEDRLTELQRKFSEEAQARRKEHHRIYGWPIDADCSFCGDTGAPAGKIGDYCSCQAGQIAHRNDEVRAARERQWLSIGVPRRFQGARLQASIDADAASTVLKWASMRPLLGGGLILVGEHGTGKTWLASAILRHLHDEGQHPLIFASTIDVLTAAGYTNGDPALIDRCKRAAVLCLDDLGAERDSEWQTEQLFALIDARYRDELPNIITTNVDLNGLRKFLGVRIADRLLDDVTIVPVGV
jgi:DNA replication protein DnaC